MTAVTPSFTPTDEQQDALDRFAIGKSLAIQAGAGTGKTATLKLLAQSTPRRGQYIAFNKAIVEEAKAKMPSTVNASTAHSLAYRNTVARNAWMADRLRHSARMKSTEIAQRLRIDQIDLTLQDGTFKRLHASYLAGVCMRSVIRFCQSADLEPDAKHVAYIDGIDLPPGARDNNRIVAKALVAPMRKAWADIIDPQGSLPFRHDHYLKMWHLSGPRINADYILFDEAQDANPVLVDIVRQQTHAQLVWVGDSQQQIYSFTGAINALASVGAEQEAYLSQSFRFGPAIADIANRCLDGLNAKLRLTGTDTVDSCVEAIDDPECVILSRTNASAVRELLNAVRDGQRAHLIGGGKDVVDFAKAARELMEKGFTPHPELACFASWGEVQTYVEQDEQGSDLKLLVGLIDEFGVDKILGALERMPREENADLILSTAHKAKGREWDRVKLADDFPAEPKDEELRLLYVAVTRAKHRLDITAIKWLTNGQPLSLQPVADTAETTIADACEHCGNFDCEGECQDDIGDEARAAAIDAETRNEIEDAQADGHEPLSAEARAAVAGLLEPTLTMTAAEITALSDYAYVHKMDDYTLTRDAESGVLYVNRRRSGQPYRLTPLEG